MRRYRPRTLDRAFVLRIVTDFVEWLEQIVFEEDESAAVDPPAGHHNACSYFLIFLTNRCVTKHTLHPSRARTRAYMHTSPNVQPM